MVKGKQSCVVPTQWMWRQIFNKLLTIYWKKTKNRYCKSVGKFADWMSKVYLSLDQTSIVPFNSLRQGVGPHMRIWRLSLSSVCAISLQKVWLIKLSLLCKYLCIALYFCSLQPFVVVLSFVFFFIYWNNRQGQHCHLVAQLIHEKKG